MRRTQMPRVGRAGDQPEPPDPRVERARELVLRHGWNATAYQILNPGISLWFAPGNDAVVGFVDSHGVRVVAGAPVCPDEHLAAVVEAFERDSAREGLRVCYFCAGTRLRAVAGREARYGSVVIGAQPAWDPDDWVAMVGEHASLRAQLHRARNKGVRVEEWTAARAAGDPELRRCLSEWLATRGLPPLHFLVETRTLDRVYDRRVFVAVRGNEVAGFLVASPIPARSGWLIEQIIRGRGAPNGTAELMIDAAVRAVGEDGSHYVTLGLSPLSVRAGPLGAGGPGWLRALLAWMRVHVHRFYNFEGLENFKAKFRPAVWEPIFAIAVGGFTPRILHGIAGAFSDGSVSSTIARALLAAARQELRWLTERTGRDSTGAVPLPAHPSSSRSDTDH
jgi:phosphatidylglycerol lysyltransferase